MQSDSVYGENVNIKENDSFFALAGRESDICVVQVCSIYHFKGDVTKAQKPMTYPSLNPYSMAC